MEPSINAMALYLSSWIRDPETPTFLEKAHETVADAHETFARRGMTTDDGIRAWYAESVAENGTDEELLAWAQRTAAAMESGTLPRDPEHRDAISPHSYRGCRLTYGDLREIYGADLPDGS